jgi:hypothetical protein
MRKFYPPEECWMCCFDRNLYNTGLCRTHQIEQDARQALKLQQQQEEEEQYLAEVKAKLEELKEKTP